MGKDKGGSGTTHDVSVNGDNATGERQGKVGRGKGDGDDTSEEGEGKAGGVPGYNPTPEDLRLREV